jgi:hypothetical protein
MSRDPVRTGSFLFRGKTWRKRGAELDLPTALELASSAEFVVIAEAGGYQIRPADRTEARQLLKTRFDGPGGRVIGPPWPSEPTYTAHLFETTNGTLLYLDTAC